MSRGGRRGGRGEGKESRDVRSVRAGESRRVDETLNKASREEAQCSVARRISQWVDCPTSPLALYGISCWRRVVPGFAVATIPMADRVGLAALLAELVPSCGFVQHAVCVSVRVDAELAVQPFHVPTGGVDADTKAYCDLRGREASPHELRYLELPTCEAVTRL
jgi:hypothetical protein